MTADAYKRALEKAQAELFAAIKERDYWNIEIARLQQLVKGLSASVERNNPTLIPPAPPTLAAVGITHLVQSVVSSSAEDMTASDVRDVLVKRGYDLSEYSNPLALIHQTLKRLAKDGRIKVSGKGKYTTANLLNAIFRTEK